MSIPIKKKKREKMLEDYIIYVHVHLNVYDTIKSTIMSYS